MKKILIIMMSVMLVCVAVTPASAEWTETQVKSHTIATIARSMGLADDNPIIAEASRIWWMEQQANENISDVERWQRFNRINNTGTYSWLAEIGNCVLRGYV